MNNMKVAVVQFPGTNCDLDTYHILKNVLKTDVSLIWHERTDLDSFDVVILPGGFSYGDHLRAGGIAANSPTIRQIKDIANDGRPVLGICNGFQILVETGLLPGALLANSGLKFVCKWVNLRVNEDCIFTKLAEKGSILRMPIAHNEGRYFTDDKTIESLERNGQIIFRYVDANGVPNKSSNPNGSIYNIAGISNSKGNVLGLMPHPERASEHLSSFSSEDGLLIFRSMLRSVEVLLKR